MNVSEIQPFEDASGEAPIRGFLHLPENPDGNGLVLAHGAGADCQAPLLRALADTFCESGVTVLRIDLPFRQVRPHGPPRGNAQQDQDGLRAAVGALRSRLSGRMFLGGHSYGGRQASMLLASSRGLADALLLLSYPLHPPRRRDQMRTAHFPELQTPALFVHGTRDGFGTIQEMSEALKLIPATTELLEVGAAGHELMTPRNREQIPPLIVEAFRRFTAQ